MEIRLHKNQGTVFQSTSRFKVLSAGRRFGKTILACVTLFVSCLKVKDGLFWYVSPTYKQTKQIAWKILLRLIPSQVLAKKPNETELSFTFKNGTELVLKGADNPDNLRGIGLDGLVVDEPASIRNFKSVWEEVLRPALSDKLGWCFFIGTPKGKNAFWELWMKGQRKEDGYESWRFKTSDNPFIEPKEIEEARTQLSERYFRQEFEASFEDFTGLIWPEFDEKIHLELPLEYPGQATSGAIDTAVSGTTACLRAVILEDETIVITDEYYEQDRRVSEVCETLRNWEVERWVIDPASKAKNIVKSGGNTYSLFDEYLDHGIVAMTAENDVMAGINRVAEYLKSGKLKISSRCKNLIDEITRYHWAEERETVTGVSKAQPYKHYDHACDALRYLVMSRPKSPDVERIRKPEKFTEEWFERQEERQRNRDEDEWE